MSIYDEILDTAKYDIEDGYRDAEQIFDSAYESEFNRYTDNKWELIKDTFTPDELLDMIKDEYEVHTMLWEHAYGAVIKDIKQLLDDHTWTIYICDGPKEGDWYNYEEVYTKQEYEDMLDNMVGNGYLLISIYDNDAYLEEVEEDEE